MIQREDNPEYVNQFLDYTATILNKSPNTIKEYNYDIAMFLRFIKIHFKMTNETELRLSSFAVTLSKRLLSSKDKYFGSLLSSLGFSKF